MRYPFKPLNVHVQGLRDPLLEREIWQTRVPRGHGGGARWLARVSRPWSQLSHRNIAGLYRVGGRGDELHLSSEKVLGPSLAELLGPGEPLAPRELRWVLEGVGAALAHAHTKGIVHGSLSLDAVVWSSEVKLLRWSPEQLSSWLDDPAQGKVPPVLPYQAPEQLRGETCRSACDVYALGALIYRLASGELPFPGTDAGWLCSQILESQAPRLRTSARYPLELARVVDHCLSKHPAARPQSVGSVLNSLYPDLTLTLAGTHQVRGLEERARVCFDRQRYSEALAVLSQLAHFDPEDGTVAYSLGVALARLEVWEEAVMWLTRAVQSLPGEPRVRRALAWVLNKRGHIRAASHQFRQARALELLEAGWTRNAPDEPDWLQPAKDPLLPRLLPPRNSPQGWMGGENKPVVDRPDGITALAAFRARARLERDFGGILQPMRRSVESRNVQVVQGEDPILRRQVTITHFHPAKGCTAEWLVESAGLWCCLQHPGIVPIHDIASREDVVYIVSEPVWGQSLAERLVPPIPADRRFSAREFRKLVLELASGLHHAHGYRVLHGALSADAVVIKPTARILRFAPEHLSAILEDGPLPSVLRYQAPEQLRGETTPASEIYSFGMLLYHTVTGSLPFQATDLGTLREQILSVEPPRVTIPDGYPPALAHVLALCLRKNPQERPSSLLELVGSLYPEERIPDIDRVRQLLLHREAVEAMEQESWQEAAAAWRQSMELDPADALAANNVGVALAHAGDHEQAQSLFEQANLLNPDHFVPLLNRGWACWRAGRREQAAEFLRQALARHPGCVEGWEMLGHCLDSDAAVEEFHKALLLDPQRQSTHDALALAYDSMLKTDSARKHRETAEELGRSGRQSNPYAPVYACVDYSEEWEGRASPPEDGPTWKCQWRPENPDDDDGGGGVGVPLRRRPISPSASEARSIPEPWEATGYETK